MRANSFQDVGVLELYIWYSFIHLNDVCLFSKCPYEIVLRLTKLTDKQTKKVSYRLHRIGETYYYYYS